jgi:general secretion pathway protein D
VRRDLEKLRGNQQSSSGQSEKPPQTRASKLHPMGAVTTSGKTAATDPFQADTSPQEPGVIKASTSSNPFLDQRRNTGSNVVRGSAHTTATRSAVPDGTLALAAPLPTTPALAEVQVAQALNSGPTPLPVPLSTLPLSTSAEKSPQKENVKSALSSTNSNQTLETGPNSLLEADPSQLLQAGEQALRKGDRQRALDLFRKAHANPQRLDIQSQQRLQDHLQMLATTPAGTARRTANGKTSLIDKAGAGQVVLARQLAADVGRRQSEAARLREKDPNQSLKLLREISAQIAKSELVASTKNQLIRRVELSIADTEKFIHDHKGELELDAQNREVLEEIDRQRTVKVQVRERVAEMVDQFNSLRDEQRYAEMEVVAKRLYDMAPDEPVAQQVWENAKFIRRSMLNREIKEEAEQGVWGMLADVERSKIVKNPSDPYQYPKSWPDLIKDRKGSGAESGRLSPRELEIQKKLSTPVLPRYNEIPLSQVIEGLSELAGVNIHLDERGMSQEAVRSDTPIILDLNQEISLESALNLILEPLHLTFMIKDEVLKITSEQLRDGEVYPKTYSVADLVIPIPNFVPSTNMGLQGLINDAYGAMGYSGQGSGMAGPLAMVNGQLPGQSDAMSDNQVLAQQFGAPGSASGMNALTGGPGGLGGAASADFDSLMELITSTVERDSWSENGTGEGEIQPFPTNLSLVISQTQRVHEQIADLLEQLRRLQDLQVTIEVRFIRLTDSFFERIGVDFDFNIEDGTGIPTLAGVPNALVPGAPYEPPRATASVGLNPSTSLTDFPNFTANLDVPFRQESFGLTSPAFGTPVDVASFGFAILSDIEAYFVINASQGDRRSNVLQAPKVTLFNGQQAIIVDSAFVPFVISVIPVVGEFAAAQQPVIVVLSEGTMMTVQAVVSENRRYVRLTLVPFFSQIGEVREFTFEGSETSSSSNSSNSGSGDGNDETNDDEQTTIRSGTTVQLPTFEVISVSTTVSVPDGGTVLLGGIKRLREGRNEFGVPLLSKIPYIDRLFRNVGIGRATDSLMMMVTPHIIIQEEEEERLGIASE